MNIFTNLKLRPRVPRNDGQVSFLERAELLRLTSVRRTIFLLALSLAALVGTSAYGLVSDRSNLLAQEREGVVNLADSLQVNATQLLDQSLFSLQGIAQDLQDPRGETLDTRIGALRRAMRYDPTSWVLGIRGVRDTLMIDGSGARLNLPNLQSTVETALAAGANGKLSVLPVIYSRDYHDWYLPIRIDLAHEASTREAVFALVAVRKLVGTAASVRLVPGAYLSFARPDGVRLFQYYVDRQEIQGSTTPITTLAMDYLRRGGNVSFESTSKLAGRKMLFGASTSQRFPLVAGIGVPLQDLTDAWFRNSVGHMLLVVVASMSGIFFAFRLNGTTRREQDYLQRQEHLVRHDTLTGLANRVTLQHRLRGYIDAPVSTPLAVVILGMRRFKEINDTLGHQSGDAVLVEVAKRLRACFGEGQQFVARLGGDEFVVCSPQCESPEGVEALCDSVAGVIGQSIVVDGVALELTASLGVAIYPQDAQTPSSLLRCADIAMATATREQLPYRRYAETLDRFTTDGLALKVDLARALREGGLSLAYQPKVDLTTGALVGVEALSRWIHPAKGPISPAIFIPLVEATELIHPFTEHVLRAALTQCHLWLMQGYHVPVSVNISAVNLIDASFVNMARAMLTEIDVPARLLELEVTESALIRNPEAALRRLHELRALGVKLSIDDFGTGYASLAYLKKLPVNVLKIDKTFTADLASDAADRRIVRSTIMLAHEFGIAVVAEGVETAEVAEVLCQLGCDMAQGYFFARPMSAPDFESQWLIGLELVWPECPDDPTEPGNGA